jgi:hypothetical protein
MNQLENLSFLLKDITKNEKLAIPDKEEHKLNIFNVLHKEHDEVRLHSRFLAFLLSPEGSHGKGNYFLNSFLEKIGADFKLAESVKVYPTEKDKIEKKKIDILIIDKRSKKAIILEKKIYAGESNHTDKGQIEGYVDKVKNDFNLDDIKVIYLTLFGHEPSEISLGKHKTLKAINGITISYRNDIIEWLDKCINDRSIKDNTFLVSYLQQYQSVLKNLTNYINMDNLNQLIDIVSKDQEALISAKLLLDNYDEIKKSTIKSFWQELAIKIGKEFNTDKSFTVDLN